MRLAIALFTDHGARVALVRIGMGVHNLPNPGPHPPEAKTQTTLETGAGPPPHTPPWRAAKAVRRQPRSDFQNRSQLASGGGNTYSAG